MSKKRKGLDEVVESLIDVVYNGKITENEDGTYAVLEDPVQSTSRIISADRMEAKSPMQQDEDEEDPIPSSSIRDPVQLTSRESPMPTEGAGRLAGGAGGSAEALEGGGGAIGPRTKGRRRKGAGDDDESLPSSQSSGFGDAKPKKKRDTTPWRPYQECTDEDEFNASEVAATLK